jgi:hypothetical protein
VFPGKGTSIRPIPCEFTLYSHPAGGLKRGYWDVQPTKSGTFVHWSAGTTRGDSSPPAGSVEYFVQEHPSPYCRAGCMIATMSFDYGLAASGKKPAVPPSCSIVTNPSTTGQSCTKTTTKQGLQITYSLTGSEK